MIYESKLYHHGIIGQKWGVQHGPPYPLERGNGKNVGSYKNKDSKNNSKKLTDKQKRAIKIGIAAAAAAVAIYGGYKLKESGKLDNFIKIGEKSVNESGILNNTINKESLNDTLNKVNPLRNKPEGQTNCMACSIASYLRQNGYDVTAKGMGLQNINDTYNKVFSSATIMEGSAVKFGKSAKDASEMLLKKYGDNAQGICTLPLNNGNGHAFNWEIKNGVVSFFDGQQGTGDAATRKLWRAALTENAYFFTARLDNATLDFDTLKDYVDFR